MHSQTTTSVPTRLENRAAAGPLYQALSQLQNAANQTSLEKPLLELVKTRASQMNRCAFCLELHTRVAGAAGEAAERLHLLPAWEEVEYFSPRERAALRWTEALTALHDEPVSDAVFAEVSAHFTEPEMLELTLQIIAINSWNRFNVAFRIRPDPHYWPAGSKPDATTNATRAGQGGLAPAQVANVVA
ncbi:MAG TPA: carboxymuconolactone decarboxylase family protein [Opitutaceae bacterium]|nr:carboxymuconolactone decarboxylase family protein [Opitutaceae bacterium]